jgi:2-keto-4-pentenoate hydratase/2-oxohepta-3-ene-1,7-dioic acid hydratase in catechol pathway
MLCKADELMTSSTPAGVGYAAKPQTLLKDGDEFRIRISHGVGTLINKIIEEK